MRMSSTIWPVLISCLLLISLKAHGEEVGYCSTLTEHTKDLSNNNLTRIPSHLSISIEYLDVSHNNISSIVHGDLSGLTNLCFLKVTHCGLQYISPDAFSRNSEIKVLNISYNRLTVIPNLHLPQLRILDLSTNPYPSYALPGSFGNLSYLSILAIGSKDATSVNVEDFVPLQNTHLKKIIFGDGTELQNYENGSFSQLKSLQEVVVKVTFCQRFDIFNDMIMDFDQTQTKKIQLVKLFPDQCTIKTDPFMAFKDLRVLSNLSIVDTWLNSSVMVKLFKNVWKSSFEETVFLNITYNEDTPDGFQLSKQNHTTNLQAFVLDGVHHHQYHYPTFNVSVELVNKLTDLKFSGTGMNILPCNLISAIKSLQVLDLSNNLLEESGFWWIGCTSHKVFPALRKLSLSHNRFKDLAEIAKNINDMKFLESLDLSFNSISIGKPCFWPPHLIELSLSHNNLGNNVFDYLSPYFQKIDLSKTGISVIPLNIISLFPRLTYLYLSFNSIQVIPADLRAPMLVSLHIDQNAITFISQKSMEGFPKLRTLKAGLNPFSCDCDSFWFMAAYNKSLLSDWPQDYTCSTPPLFSGRRLETYEHGWLSCQPGLQAAVVLSVLSVVGVALAIIVYACDGIWYAKMLWVWIRVKRRGYKRADRLLNATFRYHAFISYSQHDSAWVGSQLVPELERSGLSLCVHERDFEPGKWIVDNIIHCVEDSYKSLFILSKHFVQSEWCNYELFFAQHRAISVNNDSLVFILLEPIPADSLPKKFLKLRTLLRRKTYLEWPADERKQRVFWCNLKAILQTVDQSKILKDVATDIAEMCPLVPVKE
ncbi:toll-like receptor 1 isoform X1 [Onychostoma macrolepis]|uniref:toll-like receptor 1 isoform X1 n=2 Tax=Onychostoma macrolepis TaxID=369639 RepID=UPI00272AE72A|nr:toll-like receptor 1 isoform X1 [Onychostoma macrolepis]